LAGILNASKSEAGLETVFPIWSEGF